MSSVNEANQENILKAPAAVLFYEKEGPLAELQREFACYQKLAAAGVPLPSVRLDEEQCRLFVQLVPVFRSRDFYQDFHELIDLLAQVHAAGLVHADIKPGHVRCLPSGQMTLIDFGASAAVDQNEPTSFTFGYVSVDRLCGLPPRPVDDLEAAVKVAMTWGGPDRGSCASRSQREQLAFELQYMCECLAEPQPPVYVSRLLWVWSQARDRPLDYEALKNPQLSLDGERVFHDLQDLELGRGLGLRRDLDPELEVKNRLKMPYPRLAGGAFVLSTTGPRNERTLMDAMKPLGADHRPCHVLLWCRAFVFTCGGLRMTKPGYDMEHAPNLLERFRGSPLFADMAILCASGRFVLAKRGEDMTYVVVPEHSLRTTETQRELTEQAVARADAAEKMLKEAQDRYCELEQKLAALLAQQKQNQK